MSRRGVFRRGARDARPERSVPASVFGLRDLVTESLAGMLQRPVRSALTSLGTVLGVGTFVAVLGLTATASSQIDARFNALTATEVTIEDIAREQNEFAGPGFPDDADRRMRALMRRPARRRVLVGSVRRRRERTRRTDRCGGGR